MWIPGRQTFPCGALTRKRARDSWPLTAAQTPGGGTGRPSGRPGTLPQTPSGGAPRLRVKATDTSVSGNSWRRDRTPFGPTWDSLAASQYRGRCLLGVRALPGSHLPTGGWSRSGAADAGPGCQWRRARTARRPMAQRRSTEPRRAPGPTSCGGPGRTYSPSTVACQHPFDLRGFAKSAGQCGAVRHAATGRGHTVRPHVRGDAHPFGRAKTVRPPTTVRTAVGSGRPGVRSGRPGVPERGSVDQLATRSSGAWTTRSPLSQTA
ncbi:hypothetical protein SAMN05216251_104138 [Actinacidiphila alni]|uniref:Uncharacterized protein n=1 Tax=Actinacidiphila alni TaxID=380248 RepID=A0A1I2C4C8_9ACTN|nr:hypothetical protein SAMN05216251_104138 [Actinacidiphila alni]